jgi:hypothetical protein
MNPRRIVKAECAALQLKQAAAGAWQRYWTACQVVDDKLCERFAEFGYTATVATATHKLVERLEGEMRIIDEQAYDAKSRLNRIVEG